ncbi:MAG: hypothetical protein JST80_13085 [Bdellovibrionales bacterium]|nr:hypothetical protein [Bdellovibrionales bacterium]
MRAELVRYAWQPEKIIEAALETLGLDFAFLESLIHMDETRIRERLRSKELLSSEWIALCEALYVPLGMVSHGYFKEAHKSHIRDAILDSYYRLPKTQGYWRLLFEFFNDYVQNWKYESRRYGVRLRWKARYQDARKFLKRIFARRYKHRDPQIFLREVFTPPPAQPAIFVMEFEKQSVSSRPALRIINSLLPEPSSADL